MSRRRKLLLLLVLAPLALVVLLVAALLTPAVQTFAARKALAGQGEVRRVSVGVGGAEITGLTLAQPGVKIDIPSFRADVPVLDAARGRIDVRALVARDVSIDFDPVAAAAHAAQQPAAEDKTTAPAKPFDGLLRAVQLPELQVNGLDLAGVLRVSGPQPLTVKFTLTGGGVGAGKKGAIELKVFTQADAKSDVATTVLLSPTLDDAGQLSALAVAIEATARGFLLAQSTTLRSEIGVVREGAGEAYSFRLLAAEKALVSLDSTWAPGSTSLPGRWKLDLSDADLAPFVAPFVLPQVKLAGAGDVTAFGTERVKSSGSLSVSADGLETLGLPALGPISVVTRFDLDASAAEAKVNAFALDVAAGSEPVLAVEARQPFAYAVATGKLTSAQAAAELVSVRLLGIPSAWLAAFVPDLALSAPVTGAWSLRPEGDGVAIDTTAPLVLSGVRYGPVAAPLLALDAIRVEGMRVRQTSAGLEAAIGQIRLVAAGGDLATIKLTANQKTGAPLLAHVELGAHLAPLADQPALRGQTRLSAGRALVVIDASVADAVAATADIRLTGLRAAGAGDLPDILVQADAKRAADGTLAVKLPLTVTNRAPQRISDLELAATITPAADAKADTHVVAKVLSQTLHLADLQVFATLVADTHPAAPSTSPATPPAPADAPLWAGVTGELELALARIVQAPGVEVLNTTGRVSLTKDAFTLERLRVLLGTGGGIDLAGGLRWLAPTRDYALAARVSGTDVAVGPLLKSLAPADGVKLEGTYALSGTITGQGADPAAAAAAASADVRITGKAGLIRALDLDSNRFARAGSTVAGLAGLAGALTGNAELAKQGARVTAANDVVRRFTNLAYDEIEIIAQRGADGVVSLGEIRLQSPQLNVKGSGKVENLPDRGFTQQPLSLRFELGARDALARDLSTLGLADPLPLDAGATVYTPLVEPLVLDGTLGKIGTDQLMRLLSRAVSGR